MHHEAISSLSYKVTSHDNIIRFVNFNDFVSDVRGHKKNKLALISLVYNNTKYIKNIFSYLSRETRLSEFDLIVIDNCTKPEVSQELETLCEDKPFNTIYLKPVSDMGSAGGYALGLERSLAQEYEHICILEDDVILIEQGVIDEYLTAIETNPKHDTLYFIHQCNGNIAIDKHRPGHSRYVFCVCYPKAFLEKSGVVDPRYFFRGEDIERGRRIEKAICEHNYKRRIIDKHFFHPYIKKGNNSVFWIYFSLRNQLYTYHKYKNGLGSFLKTLFIYMQNSLINLCTGKTGIFRALWGAIKDNGTLHTISLAESQEKEHQLRRFSTYKFHHTEDLKIPLTQLHEKIRDVFMILPLHQFDSIDVDYLKQHMKSGGQRLLAGGLYGPLNALFLCFPRIMTLHETDYYTKEVFLSSTRNPLFLLFIILNIICFLPSLVLTLLAALFIVCTKPSRS